MIDQLYKSSRAVERHLAAPLLDERLRYLSHRGALGSTKNSLRLIAPYLLVFIDYLHLESNTEISIEQINKAADQWISRQPQHQSATHYRDARELFICYAKDWLRFLGLLCPAEVPRQPYTHMIEEFANYMTEERGLSAATVGPRRVRLAQFFSRFYQEHRSFNEISIVDIDTTIVRMGQQNAYARASIRAYVDAVRSFFRYAEQRGWCAPGLAEAIISPRLFADEQLPKGPSWEDVRRLLASTESDKPKDIRDRALIMLFAVYGLRVGEVRALRLEDLDWENELLHVTRSKQYRRQVYPLSYTVGEALLRYLKEVRPRVPYREVFLTVLAPVRPCRKGALYCVVADRLRALGVSLKHRGPHSLRHACATRLLAQGMSFKEVGNHLGHKRADTTRVYAKVDLAGLRQVADFDLGGVL